ncbi:hypothetical protein [Pseudoxanthomonas sp. CF125]|uniref:hypothetical protein n=1 Tax=Pseudoxanthomonas sp. CF125 TaxID=1855303 RepID=UPI00088BCB3C|nr:hypothetical protein [Pseudoxanthomonas sp. CF125]SDQ25416.1 hypothetical protein SAMN05216569_0311 [Pseudoxanthomonas sp. CF125]
MSPRLRPLLMLLPLLLGGCVVFERPPAPLACDARLEGRWLPIANTPEEAAKQTAEDYALVNAQCHATVSMSQIGSNPASKAEIEVSGFELGGEHYFVLTEESVAQLFARGSAGLAQGARLPSTAVTLVRYRIEDNVLTLATVDADTVKKMSEARGLRAKALDEFNYLIPGDEATLRKVLLAHPELFENSDSPPMRMKRAAGEPAP